MARMQLIIDDRAFQADIQRALRRAPEVVIQALRREQMAAFADSQREVPVDKGHLAASGHTPAPRLVGRRIVAEIEYSAIYALSVHENPRSGHTGGVSPKGQSYRTWAEHGKWKYLEHPMMRAEPGFATRVGAFLHARLWRR